MTKFEWVAPTSILSFVDVLIGEFGFKIDLQGSRIRILEDALERDVSIKELNQEERWRNPKTYLHLISLPEEWILGEKDLLFKQGNIKGDKQFFWLDNSLCTLFDLENNQKNAFYSFIIKFSSGWSVIVNEYCTPKDFC